MIRKAILVVLFVGTLGTVILRVMVCGGYMSWVIGPYYSADRRGLTVQLWPNGSYEYGGRGDARIEVNYYAPTRQTTLVDYVWFQFLRIRFQTRTVHVGCYKWNLSVSLPFWQVFLLFAAYPSVLLIRGPVRRWHRRRKGWCVKCGYDLTGNVSGVCPECGEPVADRSSSDSD